MGREPAPPGSSRSLGDNPGHVGWCFSPSLSCLCILEPCHTPLFSTGNLQVYKSFVIGVQEPCNLFGFHQLKGHSKATVWRPKSCFLVKQKLIFFPPLKYGHCISFVCSLRNQSIKVFEHLVSFLQMQEQQPSSAKAQRQRWTRATRFG